MSKGKLLWVGDSPAVCKDSAGKSFATTGFGRVTEETLGRLVGLGWEAAVLGVNHKGMPAKDKPYDIYTPPSPHDMLGLAILCDVVQDANPDVLVLFNDPWVIERYMAMLSQLEKIPPTIAYFPIDSTGYSDRHTGWAKRAVQAKDARFCCATYTEWGAKEFQRGGYPALIDVIPHGVDTSVFFPMDRAEARRLAGVEDNGQFIVINANRNSERKRIDMTIKAFVRFVKEQGIESGEEAQLWLHMASHEPQGYDVVYLFDRYCRELGVKNEGKGLLRHTYPGFNNYNAVSPAQLNYIYNSCDVGINTAVAEGWGLFPFEMAACGKPSILGWHSAHKELWTSGNSYLVSAPDLETKTGLHLDQAVMSEFDFYSALHQAYGRRVLADDAGFMAYQMVKQDKYSWDAIALQWDSLLLRMKED